MIIVKSSISKVREIVSQILSNESITNHFNRKLVKEIQGKIQEKKKDCMIFYALQDSQFDILYLNSIRDVSQIV